MATLKRRLHRNNGSGYDTVHFETESSLVLRPSGRTVEQDLADYLPEVQASDSVPETLKDGHLLTGLTKAWLGRFGEIGHPYTHPSSKQCDAAAGNHTHDDRYYTESEVNTLLNGKAASSHNHSASNITSGVLPIARGGTGYSNLNDLKNALGITSGGAKIAHASFSSTSGTVNCGFTPYALFLIIVYGGSNAYTVNYSECLCIRGCNQTQMHNDNTTSEVDVTWNDSSVYFKYKGGSGRNFSMVTLALGV